MNLEVWGQVDEKYNVLVRPYRNFTPIKFIDCVEFSALLLVEMTLASQKTGLRNDFSQKLVCEVKTASELLKPVFLLNFTFDFTLLC